MANYSSTIYFYISTVFASLLSHFLSIKSLPKNKINRQLEPAVTEIMATFLFIFLGTISEN